MSSRAWSAADVPLAQCPQAGCPELVPPGMWCAQHQPQRWANSTRRARLPKHWARTRLRILRRDNYSCRRCAAHATEVDHVIPNSRGGSDADSNLVALCKRCHASKTGAEGARARTNAP